MLDGCSRYIVHHEIREAMKEVDVETIVQRAREKFPGVKPRIISDNGPQFFAAPADKLHGREQVIWQQRDQKLDATRAERQPTTTPTLASTPLPQPA